MSKYLTFVALTLTATAQAEQPRDPITCLADNIYYEAASEPWDGKLAVARVTVNRADGDASKLCHAVYQRAIDPATGKKVAAFSWTLGARWRISGPKDAFTYAECVWVASGVLSGLLSTPLVDDSVLWYHATYVHPRWHKRFVVKIGHHLFYRG